MKYLITFEILPTSAFGLPDHDCTVTRTDNQVHGCSYHPGAMEKISWGSMSVYRSDESAISREIQFGNILGVLKDNYIKLEVEAETSYEALNKANEVLSNFLQHLTAIHGRVYSHSTKIIEDENNKLHRVPKYVTLLKSTPYDLDLLNNNITKAEKYAQLKDQRLERGLHYLEHAFLLYENKFQIATPFSRQQKYLISAVFLNFWKAISSLVGDPAQRGDHYQKRVNNLKLSNEIKDGIEKVKQLRDKYDVAHYTLNEEVVNSLESEVSIARETLSSLITQYCEILDEKNLTISSS